MRVTSFDQLTKRTLSLVLIHPVTGEEFEVEFKELSQPEINSFLYVEPQPKPPIKEFSKNTMTGRVEPVYDDTQPAYVKALAEWNDRFMYRWLIASWLMEIPGETEADKFKAINDNLPGWVIVRFREKLQELAGLRESDVAFAKKKSLTTETYTPE